MAIDPSLLASKSKEKNSRKMKHFFRPYIIDGSCRQALKTFCKTFRHVQKEEWQSCNSRSIKRCNAIANKKGVQHRMYKQIKHIYLVYLIFSGLVFVHLSFASVTELGHHTNAHGTNDTFAGAINISGCTNTDFHK